ncbi:MAG: thiamine pyrophosphate-binding protein [Salinirussus sp.]
MNNGDYTGAEYVVDALETWGVKHVFGNPGTTELPLMAAIGESELDYILGLHEDIAVGIAGGYASTRRYHNHHDPAVTPLGVVNLHLAPGLAHGLGNLYAAWMTGAPLLVTAGNHSTDFQHEEPILSGDLAALTAQWTKRNEEVQDVTALPRQLRRAARAALTPPTGPVFLGLPMDVMLSPIDDRPDHLGPIPDAGRGDPDALDHAADVLAAAEAPRMVLGDGVARAGGIDGAIELAEAAELAVIGEMMTAEINFPSTHDNWVGFTPPTADFARLMMDTDTLVFAGCSTHTTLTRHEDPLLDPDTTCIHLGVDARDLDKHYPVDAAVVGDPGRLCSALAERVNDRLDASDRELRRRAREATVDELGYEPGVPDVAAGEPSTKASLVTDLRSVTPDAYIVDESVTAMFEMLQRSAWEAEGYLGNKGGGLGYGLPASIGAALAESLRPNPRPTVGFVGDGSYLYYPHSLYSAARYGIDVTVVIADNRNYRILKDNTVGIMGGEEADYEFVGMDFEPPVDIVANAESHGASASFAETRGDVVPALEGALETSGPTVIDALVTD